LLYYDHPVDHVVSGVGVLDKAIALLDEIAAREPVTFVELQSAVRFPKTTTLRLLAALETHGMVGRESDGTFVTGPRFGEAALSQIATPILRHLSEVTGESSQLFVRRGQQRVAIVSIESGAELRTHVPLGAVYTIEKGSAAKLLVEDPAALKQGWAESVGERAAGTASVSAPIYSDGHVVAAVCLSGPIYRISDAPGRRYAKRVVQAARDIQKALASAHY
jgi:DNA-binding IclR family transcriptional regulator